MRGLTIVVVDASPVRMRAALGLALCAAALGGPVRIFLDTAAVPLAARPIPDGDDARHAAHGLPTLAALLAEALEAGVALIVCQAGLALAGIGMDAFDPRVVAGGMVGLLAELGDDRLVTI